MLAVFISASSQRRELFLNLQNGAKKLLPIQDVRTRWNSTFLMLRRAKRLQSTFNDYCAKYSYNQFRLNDDEWRQIDYLLCLTQPFFEYTTALSQTKDVTVHNIFDIYNELFDHLELSIDRLKRKKVPWKKAIFRALEAGKIKLGQYYSKTTKVHGNLYGVGTILAPQYKLQFFSGRAWSENNFEWRDKYLGCLREYVDAYKQRLSDRQSPIWALGPTSQSSRVTTLLKAAKTHSSRSLIDDRDEVKRYLETGTSVNPII